MEHLGRPGRQSRAARRGWLQFYCESHQDLVDTVLMAFRVSEDPRVLLPSMVCMDGFVTSHTQMVVDVPEQELVDRYLPRCAVPDAIVCDLTSRQSAGEPVWQEVAR